MKNLDKPLFSVIIPVYNTASYLRECLDSVLAQTEGDWEAICVDDGSTDGSGAILDEYAARDVRIRVVHKQNGGEGSARNAGLEVAKGEWLIFVDSDDVIRSTMLQYVVDAIKLYPMADLVRVATSSFNDGESPQWTGDKVYKEFDLSKRIPNDVAMFGITEMSYRADKFKKERFERYRIGADIVYTSGCFAMANSLVVIEASAYGYRIRQGSMIHSKYTSQKIRDNVDFLAHQFRNFLASGKELGKQLAKARMNAWLENCACEILSHKMEGEWRIEWLHWLNSLSEMRKLPYLTIWQKIVSSIIISTKSKILARFLCAWPYRLKLMGVHR